MIRIATSIALAVILCACTDSDGRRLSLVDNPRILAIAATPSVIGPGETSVLDALVVDSSGPIADAEVTWRACIPWSVVLDPDVQCGPDVSTPLPQGELQAPAQLEDTLEVPLVAEVTTAAGRLVAVKRVRLMPEMTALPPELSIEAFHLDGATPDVIEPGREYEVALDLTGVFPDQTEPVDVRVNLYATSGEFADEAITVTFDPTMPADAETTTWRAADDAAPVTFWAIATGPDNVTAWLQITPGSTP